MSKTTNNKDVGPTSLSKYLEDISNKGPSVTETMEEKMKSDSPPKLVISVIGDSINYTPNSWPTHRFKQALIHAIKTFGDSWILCECKTKDNAGRVSKTVSQALKEYRQVPWTQMKERSTAYLYKIWSHKPRENKYSAEADGYFKSLVLKNPTTASMTDMVKILSQKHVQAFSSETAYRMVLPVIIVVVEGHFDTIQTVRDAVVDKNLPVILVKGSGMAADLIHYCLEQDKDINDIRPLKQKISILFGEKIEYKKPYNERIKLLQEIVKNQNLVMSFDVYKDTPEIFAEKTKEIILTSWALQEDDYDLTKIEPTETSSTQQDQGKLRSNQVSPETSAAEQDHGRPRSNQVSPGPSLLYAEYQSSENIKENGKPETSDTEQEKGKPQTEQVLRSTETSSIEQDQGKPRSNQVSPGPSLLYAEFQSSENIKENDKPETSDTEQEQGKPQTEQVLRSTETPSIEQDQGKPRRNQVSPGPPPPVDYKLPDIATENSKQETSPTLQNQDSKEQTNSVSPERDPPAEKTEKSSSPLAFYLFYQRLQNEKHQTTSIGIQPMVTDIKQVEPESLIMEALLAGEHEFVDVLMDIDKTKEMNIDFKVLYEKAADNLKAILKVESWTWSQGKEKNADNENDPAVQRLKRLLRNYDANEIPKETKKNEITERLLLWAVQTNQVKMAEMLWKKTQYPILTALVASEVLRKMSRKAWDIKEATLSIELEEHSDIFCQRAVDTAETFHKEHGDYAVEALAKKYHVWGVYNDPIEFAMKYKQYTFVALEVVQRRFNEKWYGHDKNRTWRHLYLICLKRSTSISALDRLRNIYGATLTSFCIHYFFFVLFLICLSAFVLSNLKEVMPWNARSVYEYLTYLWITGDFIEEYKSALIVIKDSQFCKKPCECFRAWLRGLYLHFNDFWNLLDFAGYVLMIIAVAFRFQEKEEFEDITRQLFSFTMYIMYMRFLHVLLVSRSIGITIIMLKEALKELIRFIIIAAVFVISTGVFYHANLYPNHYDLFSTFGIRHWSFWRIVYLPFWAIFGEFKEELQGVGEEGCSNNETVYVNDINVERCPQKDFFVSIMSGVYTMIASLLLVNLIIAMFTFRFEEIKNNSEKLWRFHRSKVISEFEGRYPSPINFGWYFVVIGRLLLKCIRSKESDEETIKDIKEIIKDRWKESKTKMREKLNMHANSKTAAAGEVYKNLKENRKKAIKEIKQRIKKDDGNNKGTRGGQNNQETSEMVLVRIIDQWLEKSIKNNEDMKGLLNDDFKKIKEEIIKRLNKENDLENIQRTIAERWEMNGNS